MANIAYLLYFIALANFFLSFVGGGIFGLTLGASAVGSIFMFFNNQNVKSEKTGNQISKSIYSLTMTSYD